MISQALRIQEIIDSVHPTQETKTSYGRLEREKKVGKSQVGKKSLLLAY
jgi:hypothetical protein